MRVRLETLVAVTTVTASVLLTVQLLDVVTHGELRRQLVAALERSRAAVRPTLPIPSPEDVSAVISEAVRLTREAASE